MSPAGMIHRPSVLALRTASEVFALPDRTFESPGSCSPPVMVVADSSIVANQSSGVVFVVRADHTSRHAVRAAVEQLEAANAHMTGSVLNSVDLVRNPYYYSAYYRKEYSRYYVSAGAGR